MSPTLTCLAVALVGMDLGYQPTSNGRAEFIVQVDSATLQAVQPGRSIEVAVQPDAQNIRASRIRITTGTEPLPHILPVAASAPPAMAPFVPANPVMSASANMPDSYRNGPPAAGPANNGPSFGPAESTTGPLPYPAGTAQPPANSPASSADKKIESLPSVGNEPFQPGTPWWIVMSLFTIALVVSNGYFGWLYWEARQRYLRLVVRTFAGGQQPAEA